MYVYMNEIFVIDSALHLRQNLQDMYIEVYTYTYIYILIGAYEYI
jgi:hypothetical protein